MRVKHLSIRNFTSLVDVDLRDLPNLVVFIGKNSSGKSNIIDAMALLFLRFGTELSEELGDVDQFQHLFLGNDPEMDSPTEIEATITLAQAEWQDIFQIDIPESPILEQLELTITKSISTHDQSVFWDLDDLSVGSIQLVHNTEKQEAVLKLNELGDSDTGGAVEVELLLLRLSNLFTSSFSVVQTSEARPDWSDRFSERPAIVSEEQVHNLWQSSQSKGIRRRPWTKMGQQFQRFAPNGHRPVGVDSSIQVEEGDLTVSLGMTGEGTQATLKLIDQIERSGQLIAIEEPETHLHPSLVKQVGQYLIETANNGRQLFISTHSPFLIDRSSLRSLYAVGKSEAKTSVEPLDNIADLRQILFDIGMKPSDILFCDAILLVEGLSDEIFFDILSNTLGVPLAERNVKIIAAGGDTRGKRKIEFWAEVGREASLPLYIILDKNAQNEAQQAIDRGHVLSENCLILEKGSLEDNYPTIHLQNALANCFGIDAGPDDLTSDQDIVTALKRVVGRKAVKNSWKPIIAEEVARLLNRSEAESALRDIVGFLRHIHRELGD